METSLGLQGVEAKSISCIESGVGILWMVGLQRISSWLF